MTDPTIESSVPICLEEVDDLMMIAIRVSTQDHGDGEALDAFHTGNPPPIDGPLVGMVSDPSPVPPSKVDHHRTAVYVIYLRLTRICEQCSH